MSAGPIRWSEVGRLALDLLVPQSCAGCARPGEPWCPVCALAAGRGPVRLRLGLPGALPAWAAASHEGPAGRAVVAFKEGGAQLLVRPLGRLLSGAVLATLREADGTTPDGTTPDGTTPDGTTPDGTTPDGTTPARHLGTGPLWLVPVPARRAARRARGIDHVHALAGVAAADLRRRGLPAHRLAALHHVRASRDQVGLTRALRQANVAGTLAGARLPAGRVLIVDDVATTGATLAEAVRAARAAGGKVIGATTVTGAGSRGHLASGEPGR